MTFALACSSKKDDSPSGPSGAGAGQGSAGAMTGAGRGNAGSSASGTTGAGGSGARGGSAGTASGGARNGGESTGGTAGRGAAGDSVRGGTSGREPSGDAGAAGGDVEPIVCGTDNCHYVRADASGSGDGSTWTDAYPELPKMLTRAHVYFVASGEYPAHDFDDAPSGDARIRIVRATAADHGTSSGWDDAYAAGECLFGELAFKRAGYDFEGRGALRVAGDFQGTVVRIAGDATHFSGVDVDGGFLMSEGKHTSGACTGMEISGDDVVVSGNRVHDIADDGVVVGGNSRLRFEGNEIDRLMGCGTDGDCGPCDNGHSDGLELYAVHDSEFVGNFAHDIASTSTFFFGNWADELGDGPADYCENILLANNVLYNPDTGFVVYLEDVRGVTLVGNTIWGQHQGRYGGLAVGVN
ncbi:MAG TPA: right-handed parallel beta-helix repeat-containing protein, partial [Polyangiaceae bacterium]|nr:right-handed parallel beta-helix repeat-containing protein [Polyangiaceae bacterium]